MGLTIRRQRTKIWKSHRWLESSDAIAGRNEASRLSMERTPYHQDLAISAYERAIGEAVQRTCRGQVVPLPGMIDQYASAAERPWRHKAAFSVRSAHRRRLRARSEKWLIFAASFARWQWIVPTLDPQGAKLFVKKIAKQVQRQAKRLKLDSVVTGVIDFCPLDDRKSGVKGWAFHVHLTIQSAGDRVGRGKRDIRQAFPYPSDSNRGVPKARDIVEAFDVRNWDRYSDKLFQFGAMRQRIVPVDEYTGRRLPARHKELTRQQQVELAAFMAAIAPSDLMIWVRHRRVKDRVVRDRT